ncbi:NAD(P)H-dependent FMN reductase [Streptomyces glaucescens]
MTTQLITPTSTAASGATRPLDVTVIIGSDRHGRFGPVVADWLLGRVAGHADLTGRILDVAETPLPTTLSPTPEATAALARITPKLASAEAFVVVTPEYNHSYPAALKNLIDWHTAEWRAKPVALVSYGGISGGLRATEHLRQVFAELHTVTVRDTVSFPNAGSAFTPDGHLKDPTGPNAAARTMLDQLVWWGRALREAKEKRPYGT